MERRQFLGAAAALAGLPAAGEGSTSGEIPHSERGSACGILRIHHSDTEATFSVDSFPNDPEYRASLSVKTDLFEFTALLGREQLEELTEDLEDAARGRGV